MGSKIGVCLFMLSIWGISTWTECAFVHQCIDKFRIYQNHTMCIADPSKSQNYSEQVEIEQKHNYIRGNVTPAATNMFEIGYANALEKEAQTWADTCSLKHDDPYFRFMPGRFHVGQNIYVSKGKDLSWSEVIDNWAKGNKSFTYNKTGSITDVSNYVQLVWGDTQLVGCGKQNCRGDYFYVCNYAPGMIESKFNTPYESGSSGGSCNGKLSNSSNALCSCAGLFCTNGGTLDMNKCGCQCVPGVKTYDSYICELKCVKNGDHPDCKTMTPASCRTDRMAPFKCPWMCKVCPYSGKDYTQRSVPMPWETTTTSKTTAATTPGVGSPVPTTSNSSGGTTPLTNGKPGNGTTSAPSGAPSTGTPNQQRDVASGMKGSLLLAAIMYIVINCVCQ